MKLFPQNWTRFLLIIIGGYLLLVGLVYLRQDAMLYLPPQYPRADYFQAAHATGMRPWPEESAAYRAFVAEHPLPQAALRGTVVVVHGNAGSALDRVGYRNALEPLGFRVILYEYPGYGARSGKIGRRSFVTDLAEVIRRVAAENPGPVYLWGESLGCAVVAATVADTAPPVSGVVLLAPWDNLPNVAQTHYPFLPARWIVRERYDSVAALSTFGKPVVVIKLGRDEVIPPQCAQALFDSLAGPKKLLVHPEATHNSWPAEPGLPWWREVADFIAPQNPTGAL